MNLLGLSKELRVLEIMLQLWAKAKLELVRLSKDYLKQLSRYAYTMRTLCVTGFLYKGIQKY